MINYVIGDATQPQGEGTKLIVHICNDLGLWGSGFVMAISNRWEEPADRYKYWARGDGTPFGLGYTQFVKVEPDIWVANMVAQRGVRTVHNSKPLKLVSLVYTLSQVQHKAAELNASVHMPRIGCGLAGGTWEQVEPLINEKLAGLDVTVYDLEQ